MNIVIPMAGRGDRMRQAGYTDSKPMIDVLGKPMIEHVIKNIAEVYHGYANFIFIVQEEDHVRYDLDTLLPTLVPNGSDATVIPIDYVTEGAAVSVLLAKKYIDNERPLLIVNSDQVIDWKLNPFQGLEDCRGCIFCFKAEHDRFSYAASDEWGRVTKVAEKEVISNNATAGAYYWAYGSDFVKAAEMMIDRDDRVKGEFYTAPVYNYALDFNMIIKPVNKVNHLGTPEELEFFIGLHTK